MPAKLALFLYPVDRGRGVERSSTEWGSTALRKTIRQLRGAS
ncbi:hypothetical protein X740_26830 [Mesorhizobium sp. LNHC221B00]|nr:hypothetical protein X740_26830 [Mesorhizobium sp. LNHC221B00]